MYKQFPEKLNYSAIEEEILKFWKENNIFEKSIETRDDNRPFTFYEGPPTANGRPGIHHVMARTLKDLVCRYKTLQGYRIHRKAGWDTHGLPVEIEVEKKLGIKNKSEVPEFGIDKYNKACRDSVWEYMDLWEKMTERMGYWINLEDAYVTCTNEYIESVWWSLKKLFEKGLIYKDYKIVPQCPKSQTVLSSHELALGYKETKDPSVYVFFKSKNEDNLYFLVWTTTPWTLISNVALCVGPEVDYVKIKLGDDYVILAKDRLNVITQEYEIVSEFKGKELEYHEYEQLFDYVKPTKKAHFVILGDFVSTEDGSGIVHIAPAFGQDDYDVSKKYDLPMLQPVTRGGTFTDEVTDFAGMFVKDADEGIIKKLKERHLLYRKETIVHSYPFSWRYDNVPVIYYARESWFIKTTAIADKMVQLNKTINWQPPEVGAGRFGNWLEDNKDWALSRDRFWATPLPIWISEDGSDMFAVGSIEELGEGFVEKDGKRVYVKDIPKDQIDLHKPFIDEVKFERNGKIYKRTPELIDVWYDSGSMPFAQLHYPFENKELFEKSFPADFICEGIDQTRGWFYTLHAIATMVFDNIAYKNVLVNELILDKNGNKMSKSRGNTVDPFNLFDKYGADATRLYLIINSPPWRPTLFDEEAIAEVQRKFFGTLVNTYNFFVLYANIDKFDYSQPDIPYDKRPEIDRWIISKLYSVVEEYQKYMNEYDPTKAARLLVDFTIDHLSNWYVRRSRRRFWKSEMNENKLSAYQTLYECLIVVSKLASPFTPFIADYIYKNLNQITKKEEYESVHLSYYPEVKYRDTKLEDKMDIAQKVVFLTRSMRAKNNLKVRQPLSKILVAVDKSLKEALLEMQSVILEEVNIKALDILDENSDIVVKSAKPNFKVIGPKYGKYVKPLTNFIKELKKEDIIKLEKEGKLDVNVENQQITLTKEEIEIVNSSIEGWLVESDNGITVAIDTNLNEELIAEGNAREFINRIQNIRKDSNFDVTDRIMIKYNANEQLKFAINKFSDYISSETLADSITFVSDTELKDAVKESINGIDCLISISKV